MNLTWRLILQFNSKVNTNAVECVEIKIYSWALCQTMAKAIAKESFIQKIVLKVRES